MPCVSSAKARTSSDMTFLSLRPGLSFAFVGEQAFFLDLERDRYFALSNQLCGGLRRLVAGQDDPDTAAALVAHGIAVQAVSAGLLNPERAIPAAESVDTLVSGKSLTGLPEAMYRHAQVAIRLRTKGLSGAIDHIRRRKIRTSPSATEDLHVILSQRFASSSLLMSTHDRCLPRSLALMDFLLAHRCHARLVFGVQHRPFHAHCWVQHGHCLLNEDVDSVRP